MEVKRRNAGAVVVVEISGRLDAVTAPNLDAYLKEIFATEVRDILLLLDGLQYIKIGRAHV
jgi:anti-anti-sigma factor